MDSKPKVSPKDFFLHLSSVVFLYWSAIALLVLLFQTINSLFPDTLDYYVDPYSGGIRFALASLIVIFPVYWIITWLINKDLMKSPEKKDLWVRKWLMYLTLFITAIAIVGDLVALINTFLGGEITSRFVYKVLAVFLVTGGIFTHYLHELKRDVSVLDKKAKIYMSVICLAVIASIVGGFIVMGSPSSQRLQRLDDRREQDLQGIQWQILNYWQQKQVLPKTLSELNNPISSFMVPNDPDTNQPYEYKAKGGTTFELCATFAAIDSGKSSNSMPYPVSTNTFENATWQHGVGRTCFTRTIDPELYPPTRPIKAVI